MPKVSTKPAGRIHMVAGSDESEVARAARELAARLSPPDAGDFGVEIIDGLADGADTAVARIHQTLDALRTVPFFGGDKLVWLKGATFFADTPTGKAEGVLEAVGELADLLVSGLPGDIIFLLSAPEMDKRRAFYKSLSKVAELHLFDRIDVSREGWEESAADRARTQAGERGFDFEPDALELFVLLAGADAGQIAVETEKLSLHLGPGRKRATGEDVRLLVPQTHAAVIWELGNAILAKNPGAAIALLQQLLRNGESAVGILLVAIIPSVRNLLLVKDLMQRHRLRPPDKPYFFGSTLKKLAEASTRHLPKKKDGTVNAFPLGLAASNAHRFTLRELRRAHTACLQANLQLVTSQLQPELVLGKLLLQILSGQNTARTAQ